MNKSLYEKFDEQFPLSKSREHPTIWTKFLQSEVKAFLRKALEELGLEWYEREHTNLIEQKRRLRLSEEKVLEVIHNVENKTKGHYDTTDLAKAIIALQGDKE